MLDCYWIQTNIWPGVFDSLVPYSGLTLSGGKETNKNPKKQQPCNPSFFFQFPVCLALMVLRTKIVLCQFNAGRIAFCPLFTVFVCQKMAHPWKSCVGHTAGGFLCTATTSPGRPHSLQQKNTNQWSVSEQSLEILWKFWYLPLVAKKGHTFLKCWENSNNVLLCLLVTAKPRSIRA